MKISIENLEFPLCVRKKILFIKGITKLKLDYIAGKNIQFNKTNLVLREPHKIVMSNKTSSIVLLNYEYDNNLYNINGYINYQILLIICYKKIWTKIE